MPCLCRLGITGLSLQDQDIKSFPNNPWQQTLLLFFFLFCHSPGIA